MTRNLNAATKVAGSTALVVLFALATAGCSGGSSGGGGGTPSPSPTPTNVAPVLGAVALTPNPVTSGQAVSGSGTVTDADNDSLLVVVTQTSGTPVGTVNGNVSGNTLTLSFTAPTVTSAESLAFKVEVDDQQGHKVDVSTSMTVNPVGSPPPPPPPPVQMSVTNISRYGLGATGASASQPLGNGSIAYVISGSNFTKHDVNVLRVYVTPGNLLLRPTLTSDLHLEVERSMVNTLASETWQVVAVDSPTGTTIVDTATGQVTVNHVLAGKTFKAYSGEEGNSNLGSMIGHEVSSTGAFSAPQTFIGNNGHKWKGGFAAPVGANHLFAPALSGTDMQVFRVDLTGAIAPIVKTLVTGTVANQQTPKAIRVLRNGDIALLSVDTRSTSNNYRVRRILSDLSLFNSPIELDGVNRLPSGTPIVGFSTMTWSQGVNGDEADYALVAAGGTVNRLYIVNLRTGTFQSSDLQFDTGGANDTTFSPDSISLIRSPTTGGWRLDLLGSLTGVGTIQRVYVFSPFKPLYSPTRAVSVNGNNNPVMGVVAYYDEANSRYVLWVGSQSTTVVSSYDTSNSMATLPNSISLGNNRFVRELINAPGLGGVVVGYSGAGAGARFATYTGGGQKVVEVGVTPNVTDYTAIAVGLSSFSVEKRMVSHDVMTYHNSQVLPGSLETFLARSMNPVPLESYFAKFMRPVTATQN